MASPAADVARDLLVQLCEYQLHLDGFEQALAQDEGMTAMDG
jgi:hypothetical protein